MKNVLMAVLLLGAVFGTIQPQARAALSLDDVLLILGEEVLLPSSDTNAITVLLSPSALVSGIVEPSFGAPPSVDIAAISGSPQWFAFVDLDPCAFFEHDVLYIFIDDVSGVVTTVAALDWPKIDGVEFADGVYPGEKLIRVYPLLSQPSASTATQSVAAVTADYGDAPDGEVGGLFPTLYDTANSLFGSGGYAFPTTFALGTGASIETDASDPFDPDGAPNLIDNDLDERMFIVLDPNAPFATGRLLFDAVSTSNDFVELNVLIDMDLNGSWSNSSFGAEWVLENEPTSLLTGTNTYLSGTFAWTASVDDPEPRWTRVALTASTIPSGPFGSAGWDGSGDLGIGEIEDALIQKCPSGGGGGEPPEDTPPPGPKKGWNGLPIKYFALVVQGPDHAPQTAAKEAGATMYQTLKAQGYTMPPLANGAAASAATINQWLADVKAQVVCQDHILIYFVAHGKKNTSGGQMALAGSYTGADLAAALMAIPPCANEDCDTPGKCCNVSIVIESCYSGQFVDSVKGTGREVLTSSSSSEPSRFGADGSGGAYSDRYADCANSTKTNAPPVDGNSDGEASPEEIHDCVAGGLSKQTPQKNSQLCICICSSNTWDCVYSIDGYGILSPSTWGYSGAPIGQTFLGYPTGIPLNPGEEPLYEYLKLPNEPDVWIWDAVVDNLALDVQSQIQVTVTNIPPNFEFTVPLFMWDDLSPLPPQPFFLDNDFAADQYAIFDGVGILNQNGA